MDEIKLSELPKIVNAGDYLLTSNANKLIGTAINFLQQLEGDKSDYTHTAIFAFYSKQDEILGFPMLIYEANRTLDLKPIDEHINQRICIIRHKGMTYDKYLKGLQGFKDEIGMFYPYYRLPFFALDFIFNFLMRKLHLEFRLATRKIIGKHHPVCSEWSEEFRIEAGLKSGRYPDESIGIDPDTIYDTAIKYKHLWKIVKEGRLIDDTRGR